MISTNSKVKGFTLVELLIVIGILGVLAAAVVVVLNPAEILEQARDAQRLQDFASINSAISLWAASVTSPTLLEVLNSSVDTADLGACGDSKTATTDTDRTVDNTGWVGVPLDDITGGSPLSVLPIDPVNTTTSLNYYTYIAGGSWKLSSILEAQKNLSVANPKLVTDVPEGKFLASGFLVRRPIKITLFKFIVV